MYFKSLIVIFLVIFFSCTNTKKKEEYIPPQPSKESGLVLAQTYCGSCHQFPSPDLIEKEVWKDHVLPKMARRLGLEPDLFKIYEGIELEELPIITEAGIYPEKPVMAKEDWQKIVKYYLDNAPDKPLEQAKKEKVEVGLESFTVKNLYGLANKAPHVTLVKFNPAQNDMLVAFRSQNSYLKRFDLNLMKKDSLAVSSPIADINVKGNDLRLLTMGIMDPNDQLKGGLTFVNSQNQQNNVLKNLQRPVQMSYGDLNQDGTEDVVICGFGNELGKLAWYEGKAMKEHILKLIPGARNTVIKDMNGDKLLDIIVLMSQAREGVFIFYNKGNGNFDEQQVLEFPSIYGSSYLDLIDFNKDGYQDIIYTNGDNADLSISLKKYHGVRIFLNDGKGNFKQSYFFPMFGASKALALDFDLDGDIDIAAISYFTNPKQKPNEGFVLLNNQGNNTFKVSTFKEANQGRWLVMDVADMDKDGDSDIILGSFLQNGFSDLVETKFKNNLPPSVIVLENNRRTKK
ncbi:MAG: VCBS repeat-containing protein [Bacteroidota bacterium]